MSKKNGNGNENLARLEQSDRAGKINLAQWRASRVHDLDLPSGLTVKVRDVSMTDLMMTGKLPPAVIDMAKQANEAGAAELDLNTLAKNAQEFKQMLDALVEISLIEPAIGTTADDQHILLGEIPTEDKMAIFTFINREATKVNPFLEG
jgi:hypothetical protein